MLVVLALVLLAAVGVGIALLLRPGSADPAADPRASAVVGSPAASAEPVDEGLLAERMTVLLLGVDVNAAREAAGEPRNTDAIMLVSLSADQSELTMLGLPRDTVDVPMGDGTTWTGKVNAIEPEAGLPAMVQAMEATFGTPIDHHVQIDMDDLVALVDALGGVEVDVDKPLSDPPIGLELEPGPQVLDGETALSFVRTRQDSDYDRVDRHQQLVLALLDRIGDPEAEIDPAALVSSMDSLETDLPLGELPTLLELARRAQDAEVTREVVRRPEMIIQEGDTGDGRGYILQPDISAIQAWVDEHIGE